MEKVLSRKKWIMAAALLISIVVSFILYWGTLQGDFVVDDQLFAQRDDYLQPAHLLQVWNEPYLYNFTAIYRPLASFTFVLNFVLFGKDTTSFHVFNIILNGIAVWLVFYLIYKLFASYKLSIFSAAFFAVQPFHRIPAGNIKNRDETLAAIFAILAVLAFLKARQILKNRHDQSAQKNRINWWMLLSAFCAFLGLLSKEMAVSIPLIVLGVYYFREKPNLKELFKIGLWYVPFFLIYLTFRWHVLGPYVFANDTHESAPMSFPFAPFWVRIWTAGKIAFNYLTKMFVPYDLTMDYTYNQLPLVTNILKSWQAILGYAMLGGLVALMFLKEKNKEIAYGAMLFLIPYLFVSKIIIRYGGQIAEENWMYLPSLGIAIIVGELLILLYKRKKILAVALISIIVIWYGYVDINSNKMWQSAMSIAQDRVANSPNSADAHVSLALSYFDSGDDQQAQSQLDIARSIYDSPEVRDLSGQIAMDQGRYQDAVDDFAKSLSLSDQLNTELHYALALAKIGEYQKSLNSLYPWYVNSPNVDQFKFILALDYYKLGRTKLAKKYLDYSDGAESPDQQLLELQRWQ